MALYSYTKRPVKPVPIKPLAEEEIIIIERKRPEKITLWDILSGVFHDLHHIIVSSKIAGILIPFFLVIVGLTIVFRQVWPEVEQYIKYTTGYYDNYNTPLVAGDYVERAQYLSNPGSEYFKQLSDDARQAHIIQPDPTSNNYRGGFKISIPSLELSNLPVEANVDSGVKDVYNTVLNNGLAHFSGTGLPISSVDNNIVIYGHSSSNDYYERTGDVAGAFSRLNQIKVGAEIIINIEGKDYKYRVIRSKIVEPNDISIISGTPNQETVTLFTCFPNGNFSHRFVTIAKPV